MSREYLNYLQEHIGGVRSAYRWIETYAPEILDIYHNDINSVWKKHELMVQVCIDHDKSKYEPDEYNAYDAYYYGTRDRNFDDVTKEYKKAWLLHQRRNPHHWQYWVLINDDDGTEAIEMPDEYIIEMICDWWSFSFKTNNLYEIFDWYWDPDRQKKFIFHPNTKDKVEKILNKLRVALDLSGGSAVWS